MADPGPDHAGRAVPRTRWTAAELMAAEFPEQRWPVPGIIPEGCCLLCGPPKVGKSWLALSVALAVAAGGRALGSIPCQQGPVLYLALEDTARRLQGRLRMALGGEAAPASLTFETWVERGLAVELICEWLDANPNATLVVVDVFAKVRGGRANTDALYDSDYAAMAQLKRVADERGVTLLVVHHTRKSAADDFVDTVSGSHGLAGAADAVLVLARSRGAADATLSVTGRDVEEARHAVSFDATRGTWKLLDGPAADWDVSDTRRAILRYVRDNDGTGPKAIAADLGIDAANVRQALRRMVDAGQLDTDGAGHYMAPMEPVTPVTPVTQDGGAVTAVTAVTPLPGELDL